MMCIVTCPFPHTTLSRRLSLTSLLVSSRRSVCHLRFFPVPVERHSCRHCTAVRLDTGICVNGVDYLHSARGANRSDPSSRHQPRPNRVLVPHQHSILCCSYLASRAEERHLYGTYGSVRSAMSMANTDSQGNSGPCRHTLFTTPTSSC